MNNLQKKSLPLLEIAMVIGAFFGLRLLLKDSVFCTWQQEILGAPRLSSCLLFFGLPVLFVYAAGRNLLACGRSLSNFRSQLRAAQRASAL